MVTLIEDPTRYIYLISTLGMNNERCQRQDADDGGRHDNIAKRETIVPAYLITKVGMIIYIAKHETIVPGIVKLT